MTKRHGCKHETKIEATVLTDRTHAAVQKVNIILGILDLLELLALKWLQAVLGL